MKLVRHFLATTIAVGLVIGLGFLWSHSGAAGIVADGGDRGGRAPASAPTGSVTVPKNRRPPGFDRRGSGGPSLSNADDLVQTLVVLGALVGGVVTLDVVRRRRRRTGVRARAAAPTAAA